MRLSRHTDYALRVLIHLAARHGRLSSIAEIARAYAISENHLMKVVHMLGRAGFIRTVRGRGGGIELARAPEDIAIGDVVRHGEPDRKLADCDACLIAPACGLTTIFGEAMGAFLAVLDRYSLADITRQRGDLARLLGLDAAEPQPI
ncbi:MULTISPECIES: RrF2 family transcriptional regulator [unclassified Sphingomonas]|uniref:RrF2 family transcriptional regulator n=1 Tax=unclassified Sphingomonas TaxID=196159 RepID=UPI0006FF4822|nr:MULTISPECIES: Rrf2 family transcriptional regulator [unclassified Sphingomonas]KQX20183.1 Rrf2 family transcriptional regulator [Sphingomonas sp. Root1294]KQY67433.1 Rrf2 family transcriptional regulator [Sphingomonas sp. Root50]KRB90809.1 Rrf2 family transcriptional regulator [Sphingomonas sp. Root720]